MKEAEIKKKKYRGKLLIDATVAPDNIKYPTDVELLNKARKITELVIDVLYKFLEGKLTQKPRTHRKIARKEYFKFAKKRKSSRKERRNAVKKQLQYFKQNFRYIERLIEEGASL